MTTATTKTSLYVFGKLSQESNAPASEYGCQCRQYGERAELEQVAAKKTAEGYDCFFYDGQTAGRDSFPVTPDVELAEAMRRCGWEKPYLPTEEDREFARRAGYQC